MRLASLASIAVAVAVTVAATNPTGSERTTLRADQRAEKGHVAIPRVGNPKASIDIYIPQPKSLSMRRMMFTPVARTVHFEGEGVLRKLAWPEVAKAALRKSTLDSARTALRKYAKLAPGSAADVALSLQILDILDAPSTQEFHRRVQLLPVSLTKEIVVDERGNRIRRTRVAVRGVEAAQIARPMVTRDSERESSDPARSAEVGGPSASDEVIGSWSAGSVVDCSYADDFGSWSGDCATEQDVDDLVSTLASVGVAASGIQNDIDGSCSTRPNDCWYDQDLGSGIGGPSASSDRRNCFLEVAGYIGATLYMGARIAAAAGLATAAAPPLMAIVEAILWVGGTFALAVGAAYLAATCLAET